MPLPPNTLLGRYEIRSLLGEGGMGEVYLAEDTTLRRKVAVKLLPAEFTADRDRLRRFEREAFAASSLNHPNILTIHEFGAENGRHFIATEFIDGESLRQHMKERRLELHEVLEIGVQVASALSAAHVARIVHRDIKPENIMVRKDGIVKVLDFGLAKLAEHEHEKSAPDAEAPTKALHRTEPGVVMGTVSYMSPEQARGREMDARTDVWSLGVVLYEMIAGRLPFEGETKTDVLGLILHKEPPPLTQLGAHVPTELDRIVNKALRKDKEERYQGVKDLGLDLKSLKRRLEFEAELERKGTSDRNSQAQGAATASEGEAGTVETSQLTARATGQAGSSIHTTSSAEYIVAGIKRHKRGVGLVLAALVLAIAGVAYLYFVRSARASINSVAVMPFVNVGNDPNAEYLSDGLSESLINNLSQLPQLKVIARSSTFKYKGKEIDPEEVAKTLGVGAIVTGRIIQRGDELQISVELINAQDKTQMWGEHYTRRAADLQAVEAEIARTVSEKLRLRLTGAQEQQLAKQATANPQAYQLYLNGLFYARKGGYEGYKKALDYYTQAVALDPKFALAYADMSGAYDILTVSGANSAEMLAKGRAAAQKALELDDSLAEAHNAMASIKQDEWDWAGAEYESRRAIELNPNLAGAHSSYADHLLQIGRTAEALAEVKRAQELDPLRIGFKTHEGAILFRARRYDEAIQVFQNIIKSQPDSPGAHAYLGYTYAMKGQYAEAIAEYQKNINLNGETPSALCYLGHAYAKSGKRDEALAILDKLKTTIDYVSPFELAVLYIGLGDTAAALDALERAYREHDLQMQGLKLDPYYDDLRSEARFQNILRRMGLPQ